MDCKVYYSWLGPKKKSVQYFILPSIFVNRAIVYLPIKLSLLFNALWIAGNNQYSVEKNSLKDAGQPSL